MLIEKILYWAQVTATGGRDTRAVSSDGVLDLNLTTPRELGGAWRGTNPEQLFAAGYATCFLEAMKFATANGSYRNRSGIGDAAFLADKSLESHVRPPTQGRDRVGSDSSGHDDRFGIVHDERRVFFIRAFD
jgi:organic hydroperoxide reductase OsmC/OhrA